MNIGRNDGCSRRCGIGYVTAEKRVINNLNFEIILFVIYSSLIYDFFFIKSERTKIANSKENSKGEVHFKWQNRKPKKSSYFADLIHLYHRSNIVVQCMFAFFVNMSFDLV